MSKEVHEKAIQELKRLELMPPMSAESTVSRNYLDWLLAVPWKKSRKFATFWPRKRSLTSTTASKSRSVSWNFWPCVSW